VEIRFARLYNDGSYNVSTEAEDYARAKRLLSDSRDDDDVELVQVEIRVVQSFGKPKLTIVSETPDLLAALQNLLKFDSLAYSKGSDRANALLAAKKTAWEAIAKATDPTP
jgi:hypothetical protein